MPDTRLPPEIGRSLERACRNRGSGEARTEVKIVARLAQKCVDCMIEGIEKHLVTRLGRHKLIAIGIIPVEDLGEPNLGREPADI
jgi:hypothetical protein